MGGDSLRFVMWAGGIGFGVIQVLIAFIMKRMWAQMDKCKEDCDKVRTDVQNLRVSILERHPTKDEFRQFSLDIKDQVSSGFTEVKQTMANNHEQLRQSIISIFKTLEHKQDR